MKTRNLRYVSLLFSIIIFAIGVSGCNLTYSSGSSTPISLTASQTLPARDLVSILNYYGTETAVAKSNVRVAVTPGIQQTPSILTVSPASAQTLSTTTPTIALVQTPVAPTASSGLRTMPIIGMVITEFEKLGDNPFLVAILASLLTLIVAFFNRVVAGFGKTVTWLWSLLRSRNQDFEFEREYLDWIISQHRHLGILPAQVVVRGWGERQHLVELEDVFVRLAVSTQYIDTQEINDDDKNFSWLRSSRWTRFCRRILSLVVIGDTRLEDFRIRGKRIIDSWYITKPNVEGNEPNILIGRNARLLLRGDPGSGKSTLMRYLAVTCARALRQNREDGDHLNIVRNRLLWTRRPFPILIKLSKYSNVINWGSERGLLDAFRDELPLELRKHCPTGFFENRLRDRSCLILLDAFDELGSPVARVEMAQKISGFLDYFGQPKHRIVVTTRIVGYEGQLNRYGFQIRSIQPLQDGDIRALVKLRYRAIGASESLGRKKAEVQSIQTRIQDRAESLIARIENTPQLRQLATNPMLLSLIVLVHFLKVELPEERILLYRDCAEILTERWQQYKREEAGLTTQSIAVEILTLTQKLVLLRELAFAMQIRKNENNSQALIRKDLAIDIISRTLPEIISLGDSKRANENRAEYLQYAKSWIDGIQESSGILVEQGLDDDGESLIGFSHLTFQEYFAAVALHEVPEYQSELWKNLHNPAWREVVLLLVVLVNDATPIIQRLIEHEDDFDSVLFAGSCLSEKVRKVAASAQSTVYKYLQSMFTNNNGVNAETVGLVLSRLFNDEITEYMINQLSKDNWQIVAASVKAIGSMKADNPNIEKARAALLELLKREAPVDVKIVGRESLARIGDPRFIEIDPIMLYIPGQSFEHIHSYKNPFQYLRVEIDRTSFRSVLRSIWQLNISEIFNNLNRNTANFFYRLLRKMLMHKYYVDEFLIAKYPVTNIEYKRFVQETGYAAPSSWVEGTFPLEKSTYPVTSISVNDASYYCEWLSSKSGFEYRLPKEWEWEIAAGGSKLQKYPWGDEYIEGMANTLESEFNEVIPVGTFYAVESPFGVQDTCGNIEEITFAVSYQMIIVELALLAFYGGGAILIPILFSNAFNLTYSFADLPYLFNWAHTIGIHQTLELIGSNNVTMALALVELMGLACLVLALNEIKDFFRYTWMLGKMLGSNQTSIQITKHAKEFVMRGGSWDQSHLKSVTYYRKIWTYRRLYERKGVYGFRVVRNGTPGTASKKAASNK